MGGSFRGFRVGIKDGMCVGFGLFRLFFLWLFHVR